MRIHTDHLEYRDFHNAARKAGVWLPSITQYGSRTHARSFDVKLSGSSPYRTADGQDQAATWDEWGVFLAALFAHDSEARCGGIKRPAYADHADFHYKTGGRFGDAALPFDAHPRHRWEYRPGKTFSRCSACSAVRTFDTLEV
jgi:hypothetical protein